MEDPILYNETSQVHWSIVIRSPHFIAFRMWVKFPGEDWAMIAQGTSEDSVPDSGSFASNNEVEFYYSFGVGSTHANSKFDISLVFSQDNKVLENGIIQEQGKVNSDGVAARNNQFTFRTK